MSQVKAPCDNCKEEFVLQGVAVDADAFAQGKLNNPLLTAMYFKCTNCDEFNKFTFDQLSLVN